MISLSKFQLDLTGFQNLFSVFEEFYLAQPFDGSLAGAVPSQDLAGFFR
jgi:hypothetical protein